MTHGFNLSDPLVCEGVVGDGCGGGRIFFMQEDMLQVFDPVTGEKIVLLENIQDAKILTKNGCVVTIKTKNTIIKYNLSTMSVI